MTTLNDTCRFWVSLAGSPDVIDDPQGLDHPLARRAAQLGISPREFSEICSRFQKLRSENMGHRVEDSGVGHSLSLKGVDPNLQSLNALQQHIGIHNQPSPLSENLDLASINAKLGGVQS